jgi:hypothetical protein
MSAVISVRTPNRCVFRTLTDSELSLCICANFTGINCSLVRATMGAHPNSSANFDVAMVLASATPIPLAPVTYISKCCDQC